MNSIRAYFYKTNVTTMINKIKKIPGALVRRVKILNEKMNGLDFTQSHTTENLNLPKETAKMYSPSLRHDIHHLLTQLNIQSTDAILDYGSGKGKALVYMAEFDFHLIGGAELSKTLAEISEKNMTKLGLKQVEIYHTDAMTFQDIDQFTHFYLFNPFPGNVVEATLNNIEESCRRNPRKITYIYYCPRERHVVDKHPYFHEIEEIKGKYWKIVLYSNERNPSPLKKK